MNKIKGTDDKRLDALRCGLMVLVEKFVSNKNRKRRIFELIKMENSYFYELYGKEKREQGLVEGRAEKAYEIIKNLLKRGYDIEEISQIVELPVQDIKSIKF